MTDMRHPDRIAGLRQALATAELDALLVLIAANRRYLSGFRAEDHQFDESAGALLITPDRLILATDSRFELEARQQAPGFEVVLYRRGLPEVLPELIQDRTSRRLGFECLRVSVKQHQELKTRLAEAGLPTELVPTEMLVEKLRLCKDPAEIAATRAAARCAEAAFQALRPFLVSGPSEIAIARRLEALMQDLGAQEPSFPIIVASGPNSALPHAVPTARRPAPGEPLLLDWGARLNGYCSDVSRTMVLGQPDACFRRCYDTVREAQSRAIAAIAPGASAQAVDAIARDFIHEAGFDGKFGHSLGHGTGLLVHESPKLSPHSEDTLAEGMIVTVEPGIYLPGWGGVRLENQVLVTAGGAEVLNTLDLDDWLIPLAGSGEDH